MKIVRNLVTRPTPVALLGRSIHLSKQNEEAPLTDGEAELGTVDGLVRAKLVSVRDATSRDRAKFPDFTGEPTPEFVAFQRRQQQLASANLRAQGRNP